MGRKISQNNLVNQFLTESKKVFTCGTAGYQSGREDSEDEDIAKPIDYDNDDIIDLFSSDNQNFAIREDNSIIAWGNNPYGILGIGSDFGLWLENPW